MNFIKRNILFLRIVSVLLTTISVPLFAQDNPNLRIFLDVPADSFFIRVDSTSDSLKLPHAFIIPRSEKVLKNNFRLLDGIHYRLFPEKGLLRFFPPLTENDSLFIKYQRFPFPLIREYYHRELQKIEPADSSQPDSSQISGVLQRRLAEEIDSFSGNLQKSGSIVRGFEIGNNRDLTLNSGLNLELSGNITPNVELIAALTDESTPLQPEGNTQTLREVDKVFVKINSPYLGGTLGDFNLSYQNSAFGNLNRKLQGISAYGKANQFHHQLTYATSRGTFHSNQFLGQEGNQGPYQLTGKNGEREIIVLAGTEKIFVNGIEQIRGENNDYVIDYSLGQITFSNKRLITSEDRIEVDFEYANNFQRYGKSLVGFSASKTPAGKGFQYDLRFFREWDDTKNLLEDSAPLTGEEITALEAAGDNPLDAAVSGVKFLGDGNGNYIRQDTLLQGKTQSYYKFVGTGKGDYSVSFTSVGRGNGSYNRERLGVYRFSGEGKGAYLPIRLVPLAGDKKFADLTASYQIGKNFRINAEAAVSNFDQNIFSRLDDQENVGNAVLLGSRYTNEALKLFDAALGRLDWEVNWRKRDNRFSQLDRAFRPEYNYKWNLSSAALSSEENIFESVLNYRPAPSVQFNFDAGSISKGDLTNSQRLSGRFRSTDSTKLKVELFGERVESEFLDQTSSWQRFGGGVGKKVWKMLPWLSYRSEDRKFNNQDNNNAGFQFDERGVGLKLFSLIGMNFNLESRLRRDFLYNPDMQNEKLNLSQSVTTGLSARILNSKNWQGRMSLSYREKDFDPFFEQMSADSIARYQPDPQFQDTTWNDRQSHLANLELQYRNQDRTLDSRWNYKIASELQGSQEKVFLEVEENRGNYRFDEDLQEYVPDPIGDYLLIIVPTGKFESVTNVEAGWQFRYRPKISREKLKGFKKILKNISTFTYLRIDEKSRENDIWQLYLLNLKKYHNNSTTVRGTYQINQDIYIFERNPDFGITLRSRFRDNLFNQYVDASFNETNRIWDRSVIWRQKILNKILTQELEYKQSSNYRSVLAVPSRNRDIFGHSAILKYNYRPVYAWQLRLHFEGGLQNDRAELNQLNARYFEFSPQVNYAVRAKARAIARMTYLNVNISSNPFNRPLPYEMGKGKKEGNSLNWNLRFEYFVSSNVTVTVNYTGRKDAGTERTIHLGQAEVRAFF